MGYKKARRTCTSAAYQLRPVTKASKLGGKKLWSMVTTKKGEGERRRTPKNINCQDPEVRVVRRGERCRTRISAAEESVAAGENVTRSLVPSLIHSLGDAQKRKLSGFGCPSRAPGRTFRAARCKAGHSVSSARRRSSSRASLLLEGDPSPGDEETRESCSSATMSARSGGVRRLRQKQSACVSCRTNQRARCPCGSHGTQRNGVFPSEIARRAKRG
jgi:hypothetical protein